MGQHFSSAATHRAEPAACLFSYLRQLINRQGTCLVSVNSACTLGTGVPVREQKQLGKHLMAEPQRPKSSDSLSDVSDGVAEPIEEELFAQAAYLINYFAHRRGFQFLREVSLAAACCFQIRTGSPHSLHAPLPRPALHSLIFITQLKLGWKLCLALPEGALCSYLHQTHQPRPVLSVVLRLCLQVFRQRPKYSMQVLHDALRILLEAGELATDRLFAMFARVGGQTPNTASWRQQ